MSERILTDLHTHSTCSDGALSPAKLVRFAAARGVGAFALTDHDTLAGLDEAQQEAGARGVEVIPGIELSVRHKQGDLHLLGYFIQRREVLTGELVRLQAARRERAAAICERLAELGMPLDLSAVEARARGSVVARPHIAEEMLANGFVDSFHEAFQVYLGDQGSAYVAVQSLDVQRGVSLLRQAGAVAVLAHPQVNHCAEELDDLCRLGIQGIEVWHPSHDEERQAFYLSECQRLGLVATGGSDFHRESPTAILPGDMGVGRDRFEELRQMAG